MVSMLKPFEAFEQEYKERRKADPTYNNSLAEDIYQALVEMSAYADKLAEGLPMLPKDVEVIHAANLALAEEVLRMQNALIKITQNGYLTRDQVLRMLSDETGN